MTILCFLEQHPKHLFLSHFEITTELIVFLRKSKKKDELAFGLTFCIHVVENFMKVTRTPLYFSSQYTTCLIFALSPPLMLRESHRHHTSIFQALQMHFPRTEYNVATAQLFKVGYFILHYLITLYQVSYLDFVHWLL